jgi:hypothetical protein
MSSPGDNECEPRIEYNFKWGIVKAILGCRTPKAGGTSAGVERSMTVALCLGDQEWLCHWQSHYRCAHRSAIDAI